MAGRTHGMHAEPTTFGVKLPWACRPPPPPAPGRGPRRDRRRQAVRRRGHPRERRPRRGAQVCERLGLAPEPATQIVRATATPSSCGPARRSARRWSGSPPRSATCSAPRWARPRSPSRPGRRARRPCPTSATRSPCERLPAWRASCAATSVPASRTWPCGTSATSATRRWSASSCPTRPCSPTTCWSRCALWWRGWTSTPSACGEPRPLGGLVFSQPVLLALVATGLGRDDAYSIVQDNASTPTRSAGSSAPSWRPTTGCPSPPSSSTRRSAWSAALARADGSFDGWSDHNNETGWRNVGSPTWSHSGKVRDIYDVGDGPADGDHRPHLRLRRGDRQPIPDKGRVLTGLAKFWLGERPTSPPATSAAIVADAAAPRAGPWSCGGAHAHRSSASSAATSPARLERVPGSRRLPGEPLPAGLRESDRLPEPLFTPSTKAERGSTTRTSPSEAAAWSEPTWSRRRRQLAGDGRRAAARAAERGIVIADTKLEFGSSTASWASVDEVLTPTRRASGRIRLGAGRHPARFDSSPARLAGGDRLGQGAPPADAAGGRRLHHVGRYVDAYERLAGKSRTDWQGARYAGFPVPRRGPARSPSSPTPRAPY